MVGIPINLQHIITYGAFSCHDCALVQARGVGLGRNSPGLGNTSIELKVQPGMEMLTRMRPP